MASCRMMGKISVAIFVFVVVVGGGCSKKSQDINACTLLNEGEVSLLSTAIKGHDYFPKEGDKPEICVWHDGASNNLVMIFFYDSIQKDPRDLVTSGMKGKEARITAIRGVGDVAAAAFAPSLDNAGREEMRLFAAENVKGIVGIRAKHIGDENSPEFASVKSLARTALSRIQ